MWVGVLTALSVSAVVVRLSVNRLSSSKSVNLKDLSNAADKGLQADQAQLKWRYLVVMLLVRFADWLQGPYFYDLYANKIDSRTGELFTPGAVSTLFLVGFCSGMVFGTLAGSLADSFGRKEGCLVCLAVFATETLMVEASSYVVLFLGRILAGLASSMLHSVFEAWFLAEAKRLRTTESWTGDVFGWQWFGDGLVAVLAGVVAQTLHGSSGSLGPVAVFRASAACLLCGFVLTALLWRSARGDNAAGHRDGQPAPTGGSTLSNIRAAIVFASSDGGRTVLLAATQCLFEGVMYTFVLAWVPALRAAAADVPEGSFTLPFGLIFSCFMVCIMIGSSVFTALSAPHQSTAPIALAIVFALGAVAFLGISAFPSLPHLVAAGFLAFEMFCGLYFPCMSSLRSIVVPNRLGSTMRALFRVPLNLFVIIVLLNFESWGTAQVMLACGVALAIASVLQVRLHTALVITKVNSP